MIEGMDTVHVSKGCGTKRLASQFKDRCAVRGWVDSMPSKPDMAAWLSVELRLGDGASITLQAYCKHIDACETEVFYLLGTLRSAQTLGGSLRGMPTNQRITDITNALREQE